MAARWALVAGPATAAPNVQLSTARSVKASFKLNDTSSLSFALDGRHPQALGLVELGTDVHLLRDGTPLFTGRIGSTSDDLSDVAHTTTVNVGDTRALLARRLVQAARSYAGVDVGTVVRDLVIDAQVGPGAGLGIAIPAATTTGITITRDTAAGAKVLEELQAIAGETNAAAAQVFDWDITPGWSGREFKLYAPKRGSNRGVILDYTFDASNPRTSNVTDLKRGLDPKDYANVVFAAGGVHTETVTQNQTVTETRTRLVPVKTTTPTSAAVTTPAGSTTTATRGTRTIVTGNGGLSLTLTTTLKDIGLVAQPRVVNNPATSNPQYVTEQYTVTYSTAVQVQVEVPNKPVLYDDGLTVWQVGMYATAASFPDTTSQAELAAKAAQLSAELQQVAPSYTITLRQGFWEGPEHVWLGDTVRLIVDSGRLNDDVELRVTQVDITLGDDGQETVALTVGADPSLFGLLLDQQRRIATLERQVSR